jgi:hypothetical protein
MGLSARAGATTMRSCRSPAAHERAGALAGQPLPSDALRALVGDCGRCQRAVLELQRNLLITTAGVQDNPGWPSALLELTCRRFDVGARPDHDLAAGRFLQTMLQASPPELGRAFGWPVVWVEGGQQPGRQERAALTTRQ